MTDDVAQVAEVHGERGQREGEAQSQNNLHQQRQKKEKGGGGQTMVVNDEKQQNRQREKEIDHIRDHADHGKDLRRKEHLLQKAAAAYEHGRCFENGRLEEAPGKDPASEEQEVGLHLFRPLARQDVAEYETVGEEIQQRIDEAPHEAKDASAVPG